MCPKLFSFLSLTAFSARTERCLKNSSKLISSPRSCFHVSSLTHYLSDNFKQMFTNTFCLAFLLILVEKKDPNYLIYIPGSPGLCSQTECNAKQSLWVRRHPQNSPFIEIKAFEQKGLNEVVNQLLKTQKSLIIYISIYLYAWGSCWIL